MVRERANDYTKKVVRFFLVKSGAWEWAQLKAANEDMHAEQILSPEAVEHEEVEEQQEDWQADFEEALQQLEEEEIADAEIQIPEPPPSTDTGATDTGATDTGATDTGATDSGEQRALTLDNVQAVFDELVRPALQADGGDITLVKVEDNNVYVELIGACSTCPSATMTMKMGIEQMLHDEFPDLGELINVAGESQPFF